MDNYNILHLYNKTLLFANLKKNEVLIHTTTGMNLENGMVSERGHSKV